MQLDCEPIPCADHGQPTQTNKNGERPLRRFPVQGGKTEMITSSHARSRYNSQQRAHTCARRLPSDSRKRKFQAQSRERAAFKHHLTMHMFSEARMGATTFTLNCVLRARFRLSTISVNCRGKPLLFAPLGSTKADKSFSLSLARG